MVRVYIVTKCRTTLSLLLFVFYTSVRDIKRAVHDPKTGRTKKKAIKNVRKAIKDSIFLEALPNQNNARSLDEKKSILIIFI